MIAWIFIQSKIDVLLFLWFVVLIDNNNNENRKINDSMMPELCEWIVKLGDRVKILEWASVIIIAVSFAVVFVQIENEW